MIRKATKVEKDTYLVWAGKGCHSLSRILHIDDSLQDINNRLDMFKQVYSLSPAMMNRVEELVIRNKLLNK